MTQTQPTAEEIGPAPSALADTSSGNARSPAGPEGEGGSSALSPDPPTSEKGDEDHIDARQYLLHGVSSEQLEGPDDNGERRAARQGPVRAEKPDLEEENIPTDLLAAEAATGYAQPDSSLEDLRKKILESKGERAQLPPGWDDRLAVAVTEEDEGGIVQETLPSCSSSSSSSDTSSSDDDDSSEDEGEKIAMLSDYDSDDSLPATKADGDGPRGPMTKSELHPSKAVELLGQLPFEQVPDDQMQNLKILGKVHGSVQQVLVIAQAEERPRDSKGTVHMPPAFRSIGGASNDRQGPILDAGSLVCTCQGKVIGLIFETFGSLLSPMYSILLPSADIASTYQPAQEVFYLPSHSSILRPAELRASQGKASDASNVNDEEAGIDEMEFSDDEEEAEYRRRLKASRKSANLRTPSDRTLIDASSDASAHTRGNLSRGPERGRGRGKGAAGRGRGGKGVPLSSPHGARSESKPELFALPQRPSWHLDEPMPSSPGSLSYGEPSNVETSFEGRSRPKAYDSGLFTPPVSAGLPALPKKAAELADEIEHSNMTSKTSAPARPIHALPKAPISTAAPTSTGSANNTTLAPPAPRSQIITPYSGASASNPPSQYSSGTSDVPIPPFPLAAPPPGVHINPLFARRWATHHHQQQQQQQQHHQQQNLPPYYPSGQQQEQPYHFIQEQQYYAQPNQMWVGDGAQDQVPTEPRGEQRHQLQHHHFLRQPQYPQHANYSAPMSGYAPPYSPHGGYWPQTSQSPRMYGVAPSDPLQASSGLAHIQSSYSPQQYHDGGTEDNTAYDPNNGRMDFSK